MKKKSKFRSVLQWIGKNKLFTLGIIIVGIYLLAGIFAPLIAPSDPGKANPSIRLLKPFQDPAHWLGYAILVREEFSCLEFIMNRDTINWILKKTEYRRSNMEHLPKKIHQNGISYTLVGDYYIPDLKLPEESRPIGRWGRMHKAFLQEHRPGQYNALLLSGKLWTYLADLNEQAADRLACIVSQMQKAEAVTEELKARDQLAWVEAMNSIRSRAEEIILSEMIFV